MIYDHEFPNALFRTEETARGGFALQSESLRKDRNPYKPSFVDLLGVLRATKPDGTIGFCNRVRYAGGSERLFGPGEIGDSREALEQQGWTFELVGTQIP